MFPCAVKLDILTWELLKQCQKNVQFVSMLNEPLTETGDAFVFFRVIWEAQWISAGNAVTDKTQPCSECLHHCLQASVSASMFQLKAQFCIWSSEVIRQNVSSHSKVAVYISLRNNSIKWRRITVKALWWCYSLVCLYTVAVYIFV